MLATIHVTILYHPLAKNLKRLKHKIIISHSWFTYE